MPLKDIIWELFNISHLIPIRRDDSRNVIIHLTEDVKNVNCNKITLLMHFLSQCFAVTLSDKIRVNHLSKSKKKGVEESEGEFHWKE